MLYTVHRKRKAPNVEILPNDIENMIRAAISNALAHGNKDLKTLVRWNFTCSHDRSSVSSLLLLQWMFVKQCSQNSLKLHFQVIHGTVSTRQSCNICAHPLVVKGKLRSEHCLYFIIEWFEQVSSMRGKAKLLQLLWLHLHITTILVNETKGNRKKIAGMLMESKGRGKIYKFPKKLLWTCHSS